MYYNNMNTKQNLLITMGCSYTEGVGCYDYNLFTETEKNKKKFSNDEVGDLYDIHRDNFHKMSWPNRVGKKLGFDKVLNLGVGGGSASGQLKKFMQIYDEERISKYNVTIIWMLSFSSRFSFYSQGWPRDLQMGASNKLSKYYTQFLDNIENDTTLEQLFYLKCMENVCENKNYNLITVHMDQKTDGLLKFLHKSKTYLFDDPKSIFFKLNRSKYFSPICNHPNEIGYEMVSEILVNQIQRKFPNYIPKVLSNNTTFEYEYETPFVQWDETQIKKMKRPTNTII